MACLRCAGPLSGFAAGRSMVLTVPAWISRTGVAGSNSAG
jgi:hypothetical protein